MSEKSDIEMEVSEVLEFDTDIRSVSSTDVSVTSASEGGSVSDTEVNAYTTRTNVFDPSSGGLYTLDINGDKYNVRVFDLPDEIVWSLRAGSLNLSGGDSVSEWSDQIGNNDATVRSGSPIYRESAINSNPAVEFGGDDSMTFPEFLNGDLNATEVEMWAVIKIDNDQSTEADGLMHYSDGTKNEHLSWTDGNYYSQLFWSTRHKISAPTPLTTGSVFTWNITAESGGKWKSYFNNNLDAERTTGDLDVTPEGPILGSKKSRYSGFGSVSEVVITDTILSSTKRAKLQKYFEDRYGPFDQIKS